MKVCTPDEPCKIVLIEDEATIAGLYLDFIEMQGGGFMPVVGRTLAELPEILSAHENVDLILLDLSLPDISGVETLAAALEMASIVPIVVITGTDDDSTAALCLQMGAQDYILKSDVARPRAFVTRVKFAIERNRYRVRWLQYCARLENEVAALLNAEGELKSEDGIQKIREVRENLAQMAARGV